LQELVGVFEEILELVTLGAESFCGKLRGHFDSRHGGIFGDIANLVDLDARFTGEGRFQLLRERRGPGVSAGKCADKPGELWLRQIRGEVDAGNSCAGQQLRKTFFTGGCAKWHAIQQDLVSRGSKQEAAAAALIERTSELFPRSVKLRRGSHMAKLVEPCEFQQNVEAADKCPRAPA
jgi:hypothetical protein